MKLIPEWGSIIDKLGFERQAIKIVFLMRIIFPFPQIRLSDTIVISLNNIQADLSDTHLFSHDAS